jgi:tRNA (guanine10-N2)-methyltransferase
MAADPTRSVYELYARGHTYDDVHERNRASRHLWDKYVPDTSFKFAVNGYNHSISKSRQREVIESFSYMGFMGRIDLSSPEVTMGCFEECEFCIDFTVQRDAQVINDVRRTDPDVQSATRHAHKGGRELREIFFGRLVRRGPAGPRLFGYSDLEPLDRARQRPFPDQNFRRQEAAVFRQYKHGS